MQEAVHLRASRVLGCARECSVFRLQCVVVGDADGVDAGREFRIVGDALHRAAVDEHPR